MMWLYCLLVVLGGTSCLAEPAEDIVSYVANPTETTIEMFLEEDAGKPLGSVAKLKKAVEAKGKKLVFAMNGGMFMENLRPLGLYVEGGKTIRKANLVQEAYGNFYLQPNGVFYLSKDGKAGVCKTKDVPAATELQYATQSGPMLVIDGKRHPKFLKKSKSLYIRNGVGILPSGDVIFAISKKPINFYDFATFFLSKGCKDALYLDGSVSRMYLAGSEQQDLYGEVGVIIAVVE